VLSLEEEDRGVAKGEGGILALGTGETRGFLCTTLSDCGVVIEVRLALEVFTLAGVTFMTASPVVLVLILALVS